MIIFPWIQPSKVPFPVSSEENDYARLIVDNLPFLEKQCRRSVSLHAGGGRSSYGSYVSSDCAASENEADELLNELLDHLKADDYRVLRQFQGKAKLTTYLTTAISNLVIDLVRKKKGRSRAKERAREMGEVAAHLYDAVYCRDYSLGEAQGFLQATWGITAGHAELGVMLERMRGRESYQTPAEICQGWPHSGKEIMTRDGMETSLADPARSAEQMLADDQRERSARHVLEAVLKELSGEERLILSLRFPKDDLEEPKANREIAQMLQLTEKAVDNRIRRILKHCRQMILAQGLSLSDLIDAGK